MRGAIVFKRGIAICNCAELYAPNSFKLSVVLYNDGFFSSPSTKYKFSFGVTYEAIALYPNAVAISKRCLHIYFCNFRPNFTFFFQNVLRYLVRTLLCSFFPNHEFFNS